MTETTNILETWQSVLETLTPNLMNAFVRHAIDNRGFLTSTRRAESVVNQIVDAADHYLQGQSQVVQEVASELASKGLAMVSAVQLMQAFTISIKDAELLELLVGFQSRFLEKLSEQRELLQRQGQEQSQLALQQALEMQLEKQRLLRESQEKRNVYAQNVLELNSHLSQITNEKELVDVAIKGIAKALELEDASFYELDHENGRWQLKMTTSSLPAKKLQAEEILTELNESLHNQGELVVHRAIDKNYKQICVVDILRISAVSVGAIRVNSQQILVQDIDDFIILIRTFAQNLSALWHNLQLFTQTGQRARELEILYGRYVDNVWSGTSLQAIYDGDKVVMERVNRQEAVPVEEGVQSLPLMLNERPFGAIHLPPDLKLTAEDEEFVQQLLREMGNALNNTNLLQTSRATSNQLSLATEVSQAATTILDRDLLIQEVVQTIRDRFDFYYVGLFLIDDVGEYAVLQAGTGEAGEIQLKRNHRLAVGGDSMIGTCMSTGRNIVKQDVRTAVAEFKPNPILPLTRSELALPLRTRGRTIGAVTVQSEQVSAFTTESITVLQSLSDQLAIAIENAGLFAQTQATLAETSRLYQTGRRMSESTDDDAVYEALVDFARFSGSVDAVQIVMIDPEDDAYLVPMTQWSKRPFALYSHDRYPRGGSSPLHDQLSKNNIIIMNNTWEDEMVSEYGRKFYKQNQLRSAAIIPIYAEDRLLGSVSLYCEQANAFREQNLQSFRTLADQAAVILANQQLFDEIKRANDRLRQLDELKTQFLANMSHELRTPLNSIIGFSRIILKGIDGPITDEQREDLQTIHNNGQHLLMLINEILDMAKIEAGKMQLSFEKLDLISTARTALSSLKTLVKPNVELIWDVDEEIPEIEADQVRVKQILMNLLSNASKYTEEGSIRLEIRTHDDPAYAHIAVHDTGIGIAPEDFEKLFRAFEQVDNSTTRVVGGTGLGLPITKWMVNMHQGEIWLESEVGKGTISHVIFPFERREEEETTRTLTFADSLEE